MLDLMFAWVMAVIDPALAWVTVLFGLFVSVVSACRLWHLHWSTHKLLWWVFFLSAGPFGFLQLTDGIDVLFLEGGEVDPQGLLALIALAAYLWGSRVSWGGGAPAYLERAPR